VFLLLLFFNFLSWILSSGRCSNGEISKFYFRRTSGEPVAIFLSPKRAPGHCSVHNALLCVHRETLAYIQKRDCVLCSEGRLCPVFRKRDCVLCSEVRDCVLPSEERLCPVFRGRLCLLFRGVMDIW